MSRMFDDYVGGSLAVTLFSLHFSCVAFGKRLVNPRSTGSAETFDL